jgi:hypothetical protein
MTEIRGVNPSSIDMQMTAISIDIRLASGDLHLF